MLPAAQPGGSTGKYCKSTGAHVSAADTQAFKPLWPTWANSTTRSSSSSSCSCRRTCTTHAFVNGWHAASAASHLESAEGHPLAKAPISAQHILPVIAHADSTVKPPLRRPQLNKVSAGWLTRQIKSCGTWAELEAIFRERGKQLNAVNLLAMMHQLTKADQQKRMVRFEDAAAQTFVHDVISSLLSTQHVPHLEVRGVANALWALGRLGISPGLANLHRLLEVMLPKLQQQDGCDPMSMSQCLWGLAKLGHQPSHAWMVAYLTATQQCLHDMTAQGLSNVVWALATLQMDGPELQKFMAAYLPVSQSQLQQHSPQALSNTIWALAELNVHPGQDWLRTFFQVSSTMADQLSMVDVAQMLRGAAKLQGASKAWVHTLLKQSRTSNGSIGAKEFVTTLMALVLLKTPLPAGWLLHFLDRGHGSLRVMTAQEISNVIWVLAQLSAPVKPSFARAWFKAAFSCMPYMNTQDCAQVVWSLGQLGWPVPARWLAAMHEESFKLIPSYSCAECAALIKGWALLCAWPPEVWMDRFFIDSLHILPTCRNCELVILISSLSTQECPRRPPQQWLQLWLASTKSRLPTFNSLELATSVRALRRLEHVPDDSWTQALLVAIDQAAQRAVQVTRQQAGAALPEGQLPSSDAASQKEDRRQQEMDALVSVPAAQIGNAAALEDSSSAMQAGQPAVAFDVASDALGGRATACSRRRQLLSEKRAAAAAAAMAGLQQEDRHDEDDDDAQQVIPTTEDHAVQGVGQQQPCMQARDALALQQALTQLGLHVPTHLRDLCQQIQANSKGRPAAPSM